MTSLIPANWETKKRDITMDCRMKDLIKATEAGKERRSARRSGGGSKAVIDAANDAGEIARVVRNFGFTNKLDAVEAFRNKKGNRNKCWWACSNAGI
jgi:hypothetical protein